MGPHIIPPIRAPPNAGALLSDWNLNFGRSSECKAYVQRQQEGGQWKFEGCPAGENVEAVRRPAITSFNFYQQPTWESTCERQFSTWANLPTQLPPGIFRYEADYDCQTCCGNCTLDVPEFRLYYFEDENADEYCASKGRRVLGYDSKANAARGSNFSGPASPYGLASQRLGSINNSGSLINETLRKIVTSEPLRGSVVTTRGHTLYVISITPPITLDHGVSLRLIKHYRTSPSVYLEVVGTMAVHDQCGPLGQNKTGVFIALPSGQLSTSKLQLFSDIREVGSEWSDPSVYGQGFFVEDDIQPFVAADMNCPTFGLGVSTDNKGVVRTTIGSPWLPLIVPPSQALSLDTAWLKYCTGVLSYSQHLASFGVFDPPRALVPDPVGGLVGSFESHPTPAADTEQTRIQPGQSPTAATPSATVLFNAPVHSLIFAPDAKDPATDLLPQRPGRKPKVGPVAKFPAAGLLPQGSKTLQAAPSQAGQAVPASRQDTIPQSSAGHVKDLSDNGSLAGDQPGDPSRLVGQSASTPSSNGVNSGDPSPDTAEGSPQPENPKDSQQAADVAHGSGGTELSSSVDGVNSQQNQDPATIPINSPSGESNGALPVVQGSSPHSTPSSNGDGNDSQAGVQGVLPAGSSVGGEGSNPDANPVQQGGQGVEQPTEGAQAGSQGTTSQGSNDQGVAPQNSNNKGTIQQGSDNQLTSPQNGNNNQNGAPSGVEGGSPASGPVNGQGPNQIEYPAQQVKQDAGQQDPGPQANAQESTAQATNGNKAIPQGLSSKEPVQQASDGQVIYPQDSSGSNGQQTSPQESQSNRDGASGAGAKHLSFGGQAFSPNAQDVQAAGNEVEPDPPAVSVANTPISPAFGGALQFGEPDIQLSNANTPPKAQTVTIASQTFNPDPNGFEIAGQAVEPGGPGLVISGTPISLTPSGTLIIGSSRIPLSNPSPQVQPLKVGDEPFVPRPEGFKIGGKAIQPSGSAVVIAGTPVSLAPSGILHLGDSTIQLVQAVPTPAAQNRHLLNVGGQPFVPNPTGFIVAGQSVKPGSPAINVAGTSMSLAQNSALYIGGSIIRLDAANTDPASSTTPQIVVNIGGKPVVAFPTGFAIPDGSNVIPGAAPITVASTPVSLGSDGILHMGTTAIPISSPGSQLGQQKAGIFNVGSLTFTPVAPSATGVVVEDTTIRANSSPQIIHGTTVSLDANNGLLVNGMRIAIPTSTDNNVFSVGALTFTATTPPAGVAIDGVKILPGETALNLRGKNITVDASGGLAIGDIAVPIPGYSSDRSVLHVGNLTLSAPWRGRGVLVDGITILPNATAKMVHGVDVKLDASGNLVVGNLSMAAPIGLAAATGSGIEVESTEGAARSGGIITDNVSASTSANAIKSGGAGPTSTSTGNGRPDDGNAAPAPRLSWVLMVTALLLGNAGFFVL